MYKYWFINYGKCTVPTQGKLSMRYLGTLLLLQFFFIILKPTLKVKKKKKD